MMAPNANFPSRRRFRWAAAAVVTLTILTAPSLRAADAVGGGFYCYQPAENGGGVDPRAPYWFDFYHDGDHPAVMLGRLGKADMDMTNCKFTQSEEDPAFKTHLQCFGDDGKETLTVRLGEAGFTQAFYAKWNGAPEELGVPCLADKDSVRAYLYGDGR